MSIHRTCNFYCHKEIHAIEVLSSIEKDASQIIEAVLSEKRGRKFIRDFLTIVSAKRIYEIDASTVQRWKEDIQKNAQIDVSETHVYPWLVFACKKGE